MTSTTRVIPRDLAVEIVDLIEGHTMEFAGSPAAHAEMYDQVEELLCRRTIAGGTIYVATSDDGEFTLPARPRRAFVDKGLALDWLAAERRRGISGDVIDLVLDAGEAT